MNSGIPNAGMLELKGLEGKKLKRLESDPDGGTFRKTKNQKTRSADYADLRRLFRNKIKRKTR